MTEHIEKQPQVSSAYREGYDRIDWNKRQPTAEEKIETILQRQQDHEDYERMMNRRKR